MLLLHGHYDALGHTYIQEKPIPVGNLTETWSAQTACRLQYIKLNMKYLLRS